MLRSNTTTKIVGLVLASSLAASSVQAADSCVNTGGTGGCFSTIQAAVDASSPNDKITVQGGTYFENVDISSGLDGLQIMGARGAILDPGDDGVTGTPNTGPGIVVGSNDVTIGGLTIRSGNTYHIELADSVTGTRIERVFSINAGSDAVYGAGSGNHDTTVISSTFMHPNSSAFYVDGDRIMFKFNKVRHTTDGGVDISGDDVVIERNRFVGIENDDAIYISGDGAEVVGNVIRATDYNPIEIDGDDAFVANNRGFGNYYGIYVSGARMVVRNNGFYGTVSGGEVYDIDCYNDCDGAKIVKNRAIDTGDDTYHFDISSSAPGLLVAKNFGRDGIDYGMYMSVDDAVITKNQMIGAGGDNEECFRISGDDNVISGNTAAVCMGPGFYLSGNSNMVRGNRAMQAADEGFYVTSSSTGTTLIGNRAFDNGLSGIAIDDGAPAATNTVVQRNRASGNKHDFCDEGTGTMVSGNAFDNVLSVTQNGTDDCPNF